MRCYSRGIEIIAGQRLRAGASIEDIRQDTFRIAIEKIRRGDLEHPERLSGFVCAIARNLALKQRARPKERENSESTLIAVPDDSPTQLDQMLDREKAATVRSILNELHSSRDRDILHRFYFEEDTKEQICSDFGISALHFNRVLFRAKERFRELYRKRQNDEGGMIGGAAAP